jgi:hypothetical protein
LGQAVKACYYSKVEMAAKSFVKLCPGQSGSNDANPEVVEQHGGLPVQIL